ncbi:MAG: stage III sporulation protein AG, partial [Oscillospiraceae bacterium]|nr:stage III sporulation protein AG [Oscillospiraceae bacterium]
LESGYEYVFAREEKINTDKTQDTYDDVHQKLQTKDSSETKYILIEDGDSEKALITTEIEPKIKGVVIICEGGDKTLVKQRITDAITTAFGISTTRVCVTKINSN